MHTQSPAKPLTLEWTFDAPVEDVWQALTDKNKMQQWYFDIKEFEPVVGFEFRFNAEGHGRVWKHICRVTEVIPNRKLSHTWRYEDYQGDTLVTFELFPEGEKTKLTLTHAGIETLKDFPFTEASFHEGWTYWMAELRKYVG